MKTPVWCDKNFQQNMKVVEWFLTGCRKPYKWKGRKTGSRRRRVEQHVLGGLQKGLLRWISQKS